MMSAWIKAIISIIALLTFSAVSCPSYCAEATPGSLPEVITPSRLLGGEIEELIDRMGGDGKYDEVVATAESKDVIAYLDPVSLGELYDDTHGPVQESDFEAPLRPGYKDELSIAEDMRVQDPGHGADGLMLASLSGAGSLPGTAGKALGSTYVGDAGYRAYSSDSIPQQPPQYSVSSAFGGLFDTGDDSSGDSAAEDMYHAGDSPFSTHSLFESVSISGTYPDSDVLEMELPTLLYLGGSQMTVSGGWLMPSGLEIPLGEETDHTMNESAYYLSVILRF